MNEKKETTGKKRLSKRAQRFIRFFAIILTLIVAAKIYSSQPEVIMRQRIASFQKLIPIYKIDTDYLTQNTMDRRDDLLIACGLPRCSQQEADYIMDEAFVDAYLEQASIEEFFAALYTIWDHCYCGKQSQILSNALEYAFETIGIEISPLIIPEEGAEGYYTEHPEEVPWSGTRTVFNADNHKDTREQVTKVTVMGDFVRVNSSGWKHVGSKLGWENGVFYDVRGHWEYFSDSFWCYKGDYIKYHEIAKMRTFTLNNEDYLLRNAGTCYHCNRVYDELIKSENE